MTGENRVVESFEEMIALGEAADVTGWDFSWLTGRATEERPPWGYAARLAERLGRAQASLDVQTGGGEVLAEARSFPLTAVATESWTPNVLAATRLLHPRGVVVVAHPDEPPLPFSNAAFDLVSSRHPATVWWEEIVRVLRPNGTYFAQHVGPGSASELIEFFLGPQPESRGMGFPLLSHVERAGTALIRGSRNPSPPHRLNPNESFRGVDTCLGLGMRPGPGTHR